MPRPIFFNERESRIVRDSKGFASLVARLIQYAVWSSKTSARAFKAAPQTAVAMTVGIRIRRLMVNEFRESWILGK
jgi:hypothetical protein